MSAPAQGNKAKAALRVAGVCLGFGVSLGAQAYLLGVLLGGWLDARWGTSPLCLLLGVLLALIAAFYELYRALLALQRAEAREKEERQKWKS